MKKIYLGLFITILSFGLLGCSLFGEQAEPQEFSGSGITITLDDSFQKSNTMYVTFYLESFDYIFTGEREEKSLFTGTDIDTLEDYAHAVLEYSGNSGTELLEAEDSAYLYAYYTATVEADEFGYMLICMESDNYYYVMNFASFADELDDSKDQFFDWADTIVVE